MVERVAKVRLVEERNKSFVVNILGDERWWRHDEVERGRVQKLVKRSKC